jgi:general secretion pathway protein D
MTNRLHAGPGLAAAVVLLAQLSPAQVGVPPGFGRPPAQPPPQQQQQPPQQPAQTQPAQTPPSPQPDAAKPQQGQAPAPGAPSSMGTGGLNLQNASLRDVIDILARQLKINYILDPRVQGGVTINTYGETKAIDNRALLDTILNINGYAMIPQGDVFRIVPLTDVQRMPGLRPQVNGKPIPEDDQTMLNLLFLRYATVDELAKLLQEFRGENGKMWSYPPANLLLIQDSRRNMRRLLDLVSLFDSPEFANQRVKLFEVKNSRPSDIAKELEGILKGISLNEKSTPIKLLPVDRINTLIAVAPNPGVFKDVEDWLKKLDVAVASTAGSVDNFVYRVKYGSAPTLAMAIMGLYSNNPFYMMSLMASYGGGAGLGSMNNGAYGGNVFGGGGGMFGGGMGGMYGGGMGGMYGGGMGGMYGGGMGGMYGGGMGGMYGGMYPGGGMGGAPGVVGASIPSSAATANAAATGTPNLTGQYLGQAGLVAPTTDSRMPRIIPNPFDNTLLIQATRSEYEGILKLLRDIDVAPRQVLLEAKIYEVTLTGVLKSGVAAYLQQKGLATPPGTTREFAATLENGGLALTGAALVGKSHELLVALSASELASKSRVISAPAIIATDSVPASINVGQQVPTLTSQAATGVQEGGSSLFANNISNRDSGVTLNIMARINPSGIVTLLINQEVSSPVPPDPSASIQSPSFTKRTVQTQVTVQDGDTIAIGGIINEENTNASNGIPFLHTLPIIGTVFGSKNSSKTRTELIIFMTPRVIYDMNNVAEATDELKGRLRKLNRYIRDEDR